MRTKIKAMATRIYLFSCIFLVCSCGSDEQSPRQVSDNWLTLVDTAQYAKAYGELNDPFGSVGDKDDWIDSISNKRKRLGELVSREFINVSLGRKNTSNKVLLNRGYNYKAEYKNIGPVEELVKVVSDDEENWDVYYYYIHTSKQPSPEPTLVE